MNGIVEKRRIHEPAKPRNRKNVYKLAKGENKQTHPNLDCALCCCLRCTTNCSRSTWSPFRTGTEELSCSDCVSPSECRSNSSSQQCQAFRADRFRPFY